MNEPTQVGLPVALDEYLAGELTADVRSEYVYGRAYLMPEIRDRHDAIGNNLRIALGIFLEDQAGEVFGPALKLRVHGGQVFYYPDAMVCCDPDDNAPYWRDRPRYVFEVSSPETHRTDDREKKIAYYHLPSIESYVQIMQDEMKVIVNRRTDEMEYWAGEILTAPDALMRLDGIGFSLPLHRIYRRTGLLPEPA